MIIQCRQCRTKFRFDDSFMQGSGVWLRCSRCGHVYFQENTAAKKSVADSTPEPEPVSANEVMPVEESEKLSMETPSVFYRDKNGVYTPNRTTGSEKNLPERPLPEKPLSEEIDWGMEKEQEEIVSRNTEKTGKKEEIEKTENTKKKKMSSSKGSGKSWKIALWSILVIVIIPCAIYLYVFPEIGEELAGNIVNQYNEYTGNAKPVTSGAFINQMVKLQDVRYRRINNNILGQVGVVEGTAVNRAEYPVSRILVKGEIVDAYSVVLNERTGYAGNILTDEELTNLSEEEILTKLAQPQGLNNSNDKIMPNGQIPFMIVFPNEPAGVIKTTVVTIGVEKLL
jgi:predicted Zn finger-like uncharacterized protein